MIGCNNDNAKIPLEYLQAYVINNNSKVYIALNNTFGGQGEVDTITINKGNTINLLSSTTDKYDILYGNSVFSSKNVNYEDSKHEWLIDYNFPAARHNVNGYKNNYAILLNNGTYPYWTTTDKGLLIGNIVANNLQKVPTRMNGYTATITEPLDKSIISGKYNGVLVVNKFNIPLSADFVFNLQLNNDGSRVFILSNIFNFSNITYLSITDSLNLATITLRNVRYSLLTIDGHVLLQNSNTAISQINSVSPESYNTIVSYNVDSNEYKNYIWKGVIPTTISIDGLNRNILYGALKYLKQSLHPYNTTNGYNSNLPVGAVIWYPEVWSSFNPSHDKNDMVNPRFISSRGEPDSEDWLICDGVDIPANCLYTQIYGETKTPDFRVLEKFYKDQPTTVSGHHYLTLQSVIQFFPSSIVSALPVSLGVAHNLDPEWSDNKHKQNWIWIKQNLNGAYDLQMQVKGNWRCHGVVNVKFSIDLNQLGTDPYSIKKNFALQFNSYCCMGDNWWEGWTGGNLNGQGEVVGRNNDTINVPKLALRLSPKNTVSLNLTETTGNSNKLFSDISTEMRAYYNATHSVIKNMRLETNWDGGHDYTPCTDCIITPNLPYLLKTYKITLNQLPILSLRLEFVIQFQVALPSTIGYYRCKEGGGISYQRPLRWFASRNRDDTLNGAPYHSFWQADYISVMNSVKISYNNIEIGVCPVKKEANPRVSSKHWSNEDWPTTTNTKNVSGDFVDAPYLNMGLYRRLNPYIKINDSGIKKNLPVEEDTTIKQWKDPVNLIKYRNDYPITYDDKIALNIDKIDGNKLSACYFIPNLRLTRYNITEWEYTVERADLTGLFDHVGDGLIKYSNGTTILNCKIWKRNGDNNYQYIELLNNKKVQNMFPTSNVTVNLVDENGNPTSETVLETTYVGLNMLVNKFEVYRDLDYYNNTVVRSIPNLTYTYYNITQDGENYTIVVNPDLIQLAANHKQLENTIKAIKSEIAIKNSLKYINTFDNSLPIFTYDPLTLVEQGRDWTSYFNIDSTQPIVSYPLLGTNSKVLSAMYQVSSYVYLLTYNDTTKEAKVGNYGDTVAIVNQNPLSQNEENDIEIPLTAATLKNNDDLTSGTYKFVTKLTSSSDYISPANANLLIYNKINKYVLALKASLNTPINTIQDLSATNYNHYLSTYAAGTYTYENDPDNITAFSGLPSA